MIPAVILAGGLATRMGGGDKGRLMLGGRSLLDHVMERLAPQVGAVALNANGDAARFADLGLPVLADPVTGHPGPLAGILAALEWGAAQGAAQVITVAADTPFFPRDLAAQLQGRADPIAMAATRAPDGRIWRHPTFALWPTELAGDLRDALQDGVRRVVAWAEPHKVVLVDFGGDDPDPFFNINTPEDLRAAEALLDRGL